MNAYYDVALKEFRLNELVKGETIKIFDYGNCKRDFIYVDDFVEGVVRVMKKASDKKNGEDGLPIPPYAVYNIGNQNPENLLDFVQILSEELVRVKVLPEDYDFEAYNRNGICWSFHCYVVISAPQGDCCRGDNIGWRTL